jgi:Fic family protein
MSFQWKPITPLSDQDKRFELSDVESLKSAWLEVKGKLAESSASNLKNFEERLARQWSIETGIIERIYDLDRGTTEVLVELGFVADLVERSSTNRDPAELVEILRDHKAAIDLVQDCVANSRPLTVGLINELHSILTRHQEVVDGVDQFNHAVSFPLKHGAFKDLPNNPTREDGSVHEYCPPLHVRTEMDQLIEWYNEYGEVNPILLAAWLHHRFSQIHPYQDGNGRVARVLANLVLVKHQLFPVVITRDHRPQYIDALEQADAGNLKPLTRLFADIEKKTILEAISLPSDSEPEPSTAMLEDVADAIGSKLKKRKEETRQKLRHVNSVAAKLQNNLQDYMRSLAENVVTRLNDSAGLKAGIQVISGGPNQIYKDQPTEHWYHFQVVKTAQETYHRVNFNESHYFVRTRISGDDFPWLTFVISFHHIGEELSGVMEITAFAEILYPRTEENPAVTDEVKCMDKPFTITYGDDDTAVRNGFLDWANECFTIAVKAWGDVL